MPPRSYVNIAVASVALSLAAASASAVGFLKKYTGTVAYTSLPSTDVIADIGDPGLPPDLVISQGLGATIDAAGDPLATFSRTPTVSPFTSNTYTVQYRETDFTSFPAHSFFDIFTDISIPTTSGDPSTTPSTMTDVFVDHPPTLSPGAIAISSIITVDGLEHSHETIVDVPAGQGLQLTVVNPTQPDVPAGSVASFFDIFVELDVAPGGTFDPSLPMFEVTDSIDTPEPATLSLFALTVPLLLTRKKRQPC